jgi:hypothetical protein
MEIPNIAKGHLYPSTRVSRCSRFHRCIVSNKCQNFDRHRLDCNVCELRASHSHDVGGQLPEGLYWPDLQDMIKTLQDLKRTAWAHPDREGARGEDMADMTAKYQKVKKATDALAFFSSIGHLNWDEKVAYAMMDPNTRQHLGRLE